MGRALVRLQGLGAVAFTGSRVVGTEVATVAARSHTRTVLELGGVDAAYVRPDVADVARAAASIASGAFHNAGQGCCAVERVYVHRDVYDSFVDAFVAEARKYRAGGPSARDYEPWAAHFTRRGGKGGGTRGRCGPRRSTRVVPRGSTHPGRGILPPRRGGRG